MMARGHSLTGATLWLATAPLVDQSLPELAACTLVCAGAAMLPDLDHPSSKIAGTLGAPTRLLAHVVAGVSGGHRKATHGILFAILAGVGAAAAVDRWGTLATAIIAGFFAALASDAIDLDEIPRGRAAGIAVNYAVGLIAALVISATAQPGSTLGWAVAGGCLAHLAGDCLTPHGCPLLWPFRGRYGVSLFTTGGAAEKAVTIGLYVAAGGLGILAVATQGAS